MSAIAELAQSIPVRESCAVFDFAPSTFYRRQQAKVVGAKPLRPKPSRALSRDERTQVRDLLDSERFADESPYEIYATLLDEGVYHCSIRTMYRILHEQAAPKDSLMFVKPQFDENWGSSQFGARKLSKPTLKFSWQRQRVQLFLLCRGQQGAGKRA